MKQILIYGPHAEEYSLAQVNRSLALALNQIASLHSLEKVQNEWQVKISAAAESVSRLPTATDFDLHPGLREIYEEYTPEKLWDAIIYNNFPKDPSGLHGLAKLNAKLKIVYIAWEESLLPQRWVEEFNNEADCIFAASLHTRNVLKKSGVVLPIIIVPNALSPEFLTTANSTALAKTGSRIKSTKKFKFLHISTGMSRKGPQELLAAFQQAFTNKDDVALIIKTTPNANNLFPELVAQVKNNPNSPEIELINSADFTDAEIVALYKATDAYVSAAKAEGFNLPALEAMYLEKPLAVAGWSGHMDFVSDENAYLVDYELAPAQSHLDNPGAYWAEPKVSSLAENMRRIYDESGSQQQQSKISLAKDTAEGYTWESSAKLAFSALNKLKTINDTQQLRLGVISTYNTVCGIAEYSRYFYEPLAGAFKDLKFIANKDVLGLINEDSENVIRLWEYNETSFSSLFEWLESVKAETGDYPVDFMHIQYNVGFYDFQALSKLIGGLKEKGLKTILTLHALRVPGAEVGVIKDELAKCDQVQVLNSLDFGYLLELGLKNVVLIPHGNTILPTQSKMRLRKALGLDKFKPIVATHGFIVQNKGIFETLAAVKLLLKDYPEMYFMALNAVNPKNISSAGMSADFTKQVLDAGLQDQVLQVSEFMERTDIMISLAAADVAVFAYPEAKETASGAIRLAMATGIPIIITPSSQLKDLQDVGLVIPDNNPESIAQAIRELVSDPQLRQRIQRQVRMYTQAHDWENTAINYLASLAPLLRN